MRLLALLCIPALALSVAALEGYPGLEAVEVQGFQCVPYSGNQDEVPDPRADIDWARTVPMPNNYVASVPSHRMTGASNVHTDPDAVIGPPQGKSISLGVGGHAILEMEGPIKDNKAAADLQIKENVGVAEGFCLYAGNAANGPWTFVGWWAADSTKDIHDFDLADQYRVLSGESSASHLLIMDAQFLGLAWPQWVPDHEIVLAVDPVTFHDLSLVRAQHEENTSWQWTFGDGGTSEDQSPVHAYAEPGTYEACMVLTVLETALEPVCRDITVLNQPPRPSFHWQDLGPEAIIPDATESVDLDGSIVDYQWWQGEALAEGPRPGELAVDRTRPLCLRVTDNLGAVGELCQALDPGQPPRVGGHAGLAGTIGEPLAEMLEVHDPDDDLFFCTLAQGPPALTISDECVVEWTPNVEFACFVVRAEDLIGKFADATRCISAQKGTADLDGDGVPDAADNCEAVANRGQEDTNNNGIGDACEDAKRVQSRTTTSAVKSKDPACHGPDADHDQVPDACDRDMDGDGVEQVGDAPDNCPTVPNPDQADQDADGYGDACDAVAPTQPPCPGDCKPDTLATDCAGCETKARTSGGFVRLSVAFTATCILVSLLIGWAWTRR